MVTLRTPVERNAPCDLCEGEDFELLYDRDRHGEPLDTSICKRCGLVQHAQLPNREELEEYYDGPYRLEYNREVDPSARRVLRGWRKGERLLERLGPHLEPGARVLEVGAGVGCVVKVFDLAGYDAHGIEPGGPFSRFAAEKLRADVKGIRLEELPPEPKYDLILLVHVIEHLRSPRLALEELRSLLKPDGLFYVECPNVGMPYARTPKMFHRAHIYNFNPSTMRMLAKSVGFDVVLAPDDRSPVVHALLRRTEKKSLEIDPHNYERTIRNLDEYDPKVHYVRPGYLGARLRKMRKYLGERLFAPMIVQRILRRCAGE